MSTTVNYSNNPLHSLFFELSVHPSLEPVNMDSLDKYYEIISKRADEAALTSGEWIQITREEFPELGLQNHELLTSLIEKLRDNYNAYVTFPNGFRGNSIAIHVQKKLPLQGERAEEIDSLVQEVIEEIKKAAQKPFSKGVELDLTERQLSESDTQVVKECLKERGIPHARDGSLRFRIKWESTNICDSGNVHLANICKRIALASTNAMVTRAYKATLSKIAAAHANNQKSIDFPYEMVNELSADRWGVNTCHTGLYIVLKAFLEEEGFTIRCNGENDEISWGNPIAGRDSEKFTPIPRGDMDPTLAESYHYVLRCMKARGGAHDLEINEESIPHHLGNCARILRLVRGKGGFYAFERHPNTFTTELIVTARRARGDNDAAVLLRSLQRV